MFTTQRVPIRVGVPGKELAAKLNAMFARLSEDGRYDADFRFVDSTEHERIKRRFPPRS